jgi:hypothetical protein
MPTVSSGLSPLELSIREEEVCSMPQYSLPRFALIAASTLLAGCRLGSYEDYQLGVPYRQQEQYNYCVPASVLMWRLYDGLPAVSQTTIYNWLGGQACNPTGVPSALSHFTNTFDTYLDVVFSPSQLDREELVARQITAEDGRTPVIADSFGECDIRLAELLRILREQHPPLRRRRVVPAQRLWPL